jgi:hypothetical protein
MGRCAILFPAAPGSRDARPVRLQHAQDLHAAQRPPDAGRAGAGPRDPRRRSGGRTGSPSPPCSTIPGPVAAPRPGADRAGLGVEGDPGPDRGKVGRVAGADRPGAGPAGGGAGAAGWRRPAAMDLPATGPGGGGGRAHPRGGSRDDTSEPRAESRQKGLPWCRLVPRFRAIIGRDRAQEETAQHARGLLPERIQTIYQRFTKGGRLRLANRCFQPLSHLSANYLRKTGSPELDFVPTLVPDSEPTSRARRCETCHRTMPEADPRPARRAEA